MSITEITLRDELRVILDDADDRYLTDAKYKSFVFKHTSVEGAFTFQKLRTGLYKHSGEVWFENMTFTEDTGLTGTATSTDGGAPATILHDTAATFITDGVAAGDAVRNVTDGSAATVATVDSEIKLTTTALTGGVNNEWQINDDWDVPTVYTSYATGSIEVTAGADSRSSIPVTATRCNFAETVVDICRYILSTNAVKGPVSIGGGYFAPANVKFIRETLETWRGIVRI